MRIAGRSIVGMWVTAFWTGGLWAGLVGCGIATDAVDLASTMQAIGTCPSGVPSVSLTSAAFLVDGKYSLDHALHVSPAGLQGNPGCVYVPPGRWPQLGPIYLRSGQKILGAGTSSVIVAPALTANDGGYHFISNEAPGSRRRAGDVYQDSSALCAEDLTGSNLRVHADDVELGNFKLQYEQTPLSTTARLIPIACAVKYRSPAAGHPEVDLCPDGVCPSDDGNPCLFHRAIVFNGWNAPNSQAGSIYKLSGLSIHDVEIHALSGIALNHTRGARLERNQIFGLHDTTSAKLDLWRDLGRVWDVAGNVSYHASSLGNLALAAGILLGTGNTGATVDQNLVDGVTAEGISIDDGKNTCSAELVTTGTLVENNTVRDTGRAGLDVFGGHFNTFRNNIVRNASMFQDTGGNVTYIQAGSFNVMDSNDVQGCGVLASITPWIDGINYIPTSGNAITNNHLVYQRPATGSAPTAPCKAGVIALYGAMLAAGSSQTTLQGNFVWAPHGDVGTWPGVFVRSGTGTTVRNNSFNGFRAPTAPPPRQQTCNSSDGRCPWLIHREDLNGDGSFRYDPTGGGARFVSITNNNCFVGSDVPCTDYVCGASCATGTTTGSCGNGSATTRRPRPRARATARAARPRSRGRAPSA